MDVNIARMLCVRKAASRSYRRHGALQSRLSGLDAGSLGACRSECGSLQSLAGKWLVTMLVSAGWQRLHVIVSSPC